MLTIPTLTSLGKSVDAPLVLETNYFSFSKLIDLILDWQRKNPIELVSCIVIEAALTIVSRDGIRHNMQKVTESLACIMITIVI